MDLKAVTYAEAANLLTAWADKRLPATPTPGPIDFSLENDCDDLCRWLADDPERDLDKIAPEMLRHLRIRLLFAIGAALTKEAEVIGNLPRNLTDSQILAALLGVQIAETRLPPEWRLQ